MNSKSQELTIPLRREHMPADYSISLAKYTRAWHTAGAAHPGRLRAAAVAARL